MSDDGKKRNWDPKVADGILSEIREYNAQISEIQAAASEKIASVKGHMASTYKRAKTLGLRPKSLKATIKLEQLDLKKKELVEALTDADQESLEEYIETLGILADSPLGAFFVERKAEREKTRAAASDAVDSLVSDEDIVEQNTSRLEEGINAL